MPTKTMTAASSDGRPLAAKITDEQWDRVERAGETIADIAHHIDFMAPEVRVHAVARIADQMNIIAEALGLTRL